MSFQLSKLGSRQKESDIARLMTTALQRPELLSLAAGFTDNRSLPLADVSSIAAKLGAKQDPSILQYGPNQGHVGLRKLLTARLMEQDRLAADAGCVGSSLITNGSQQALYLAVQTLCDPGDIVFVEQPTYFVFLEMLQGLGVRAEPLPMLDSGEVDVAAFAAHLEALPVDGELQRVKAVYLVSYFANPSGHSVAASSKRSLVELLARFKGRRDIALLEDAAYRELFYDAPHGAESLIHSAKALGVPAFYTTTLTKPFASGLKVGYGYATDSDWLASMLAIKGQQDFGSAYYPQAIMAEAISSGKFDEHLACIRPIYREKAACLDAVLSGVLRERGWEWERPQGGLYLWLKAPEGVETHFDSRFHQLCIEEGVMYVPGDLCFAKRDQRNRIRLSFGVLDPDSLKEAGARFIRAAAKMA